MTHALTNNNLRLTSILLASFAVWACSSGEGDEDTSTVVGPGSAGGVGGGQTGGSGAGGTLPSGGAGIGGGSPTGGTGAETGSAAGSSSGNAGAGASGGGTSGGGAASCDSPNAWDVTYNLEGSTYDVRNVCCGAPNQTNTTQSPYTEYNQIGPSTMVIRFADSNGEPGPGTARIVSLVFDQVFTYQSGLGLDLQSDLVWNSVAEDCAAATGTYDETEATWQDPGVMIHLTGSYTCLGFACAFGGLQDGVTQPVDHTEPYALNAFSFTNGVSAFTMIEVKDPNMSEATTKDGDGTASYYYAFVGTETARQAVCDCP